MSNTIWKQGNVWVAQNETGFLGHFRFKKDAARATEHSGHEVEVVRFQAGGYPIAGWNWPRWGYRVVCSCGYKTSNVAGSTGEYVKHHLEGSQK